MKALLLKGMRTKGTEGKRGLCFNELCNVTMREGNKDLEEGNMK